MKPLKKSELIKALRPLTGEICPVRLQLKSGDSFVGIGTILIKNLGIFRQPKLDIRFEWILRLAANGAGNDGFDEGHPSPIEDSLQEEKVLADFKPVNAILSETTEWQEIFTDEGVVLVSFDEKQSKVVEELYPIREPDPD